MNGGSGLFDRRSICVFQQALKIIQKDARLSEEDRSISDRIEHTEQVKPRIVMVEWVLIDLMISLSGEATSRCSSG